MVNGNNAQQRFYIVDGLRGLAALVVMVRHMSQHTTLPLFANGRLASDIFIFAGGFMTAYAYHNKLTQGMSLLSFFKQRLTRLYPLFILGWILGIVNLFYKMELGGSNYGLDDLLISSLCNILWLPYFNNLYLDIVLEKTVGAVFPGNDPAWALALIFWASLLYATIITKSKSIYIYITCIVSCISLVIFVKYNTMAGPGWSSFNFFGGVARTALCFFGGIILHLNWNKIKAYIPSIGLPFVTLGILILALLAIPNFHGYYIFWLATVLTIVPILVSLAIASKKISLTSEKICSELGKLSYPIYCIHYPIFSIYSTYEMGLNLSGFEIFSLILFIVTLSHFVVRYYDEPTTKFFKRQRSR